MDPDAQRVVEIIALAARPSVAQQTPEEARAGYREARRVMQPQPEAVESVRDLTTPDGSACASTAASARRRVAAWSTAMAAAGCWAISIRMTASAAAWRIWRNAGWCRWITAARRSIRSRPP
ncbi:MAG: hypothetical protein WDN49_25010 [Acetobacteraceae bacterium]